MKLSLFNEKDSVLLLGEGNFSFSVALFRLNLKINLTATCYESNIDQNLGKKNIEYLSDNGVRVLLGVDATNLTEHPILKTECFDKIIFNFPHVGGKMRIEKNRELLKLFFISSKNLIESNGFVIVTLCNGQGGTLADTPVRRWDDSWKIVETAAHGDFMLSEVEQFNWSTFPEYIVTGYRSLEKSFHTTGALTHIFVKALKPDIQNIAPHCKINIRNFNEVTWQDILSLANDTRKDCGCATKNIANSFIYPPTFVLDVTICMDIEYNCFNVYEILYNYAGHIIENIEYIDSYTFPCNLKKSKTYRITYKSYAFPLHRNRVIEIHKNWISDILENNLKVTVSR